MSDANAGDSAVSETKKKSDAKDAHADVAPNKVILVSYPKIVFMYPTFLASLIVAIYLSFVGDEGVHVDHGGPVTACGVLLTLFFVNLVVLSFDFPRGASLTLFFVLLAVSLGMWLLFTYNPNILPSLTNAMQAIRPVANATFFYIFSAILGVLFIAVLLTARFDYWEVRPNELLHHHGILSDLERFPAPQLKLDKETNDVFEYMLLQAGRLILHPSNEPRAFVLDNVLFINHKEREITRMLGTLQVQIRPDREED